MLTQEFFVVAPGYHPLLITGNWQVAQLNYCKEQGGKWTEELEMHEHTDETFTLLKGEAFLVAKRDETSETELMRLKKGHTCNVPPGVWHNIVMGEESSVLITENALTHEEPRKTIRLTEADKQKITAFERGEEV